MLRFLDLFRVKDENSLKPDQRRAIIITFAGAIIAAVLSISVSGWSSSLPFIAMSTSITIAFVADRVTRFNFENKTEKELSRVVMHESDLQFIGDAEAGARWFIRNYRGVSRVKNTVFNRTDPVKVPRVAALGSEIMMAMKQAIEAGCSWTDIYLVNEEAAIKTLRDNLKKNNKGSYTSVRLECQVPLLQLLLMEYDADRTVVLFGWGVAGSSKSRVYLARDKLAFDYFEDYFDKLLNSVDPLRPDRVIGPALTLHPGQPA